MRVHNYSKQLDLLLLDYNLSFEGACSNYLSIHPFIYGKSPSEVR